jgi:hypothetical protein
LRFSELQLHSYSNVVALFVVIMTVLRIREIPNSENNSSTSRFFHISNVTSGQHLTQSLPVSLNPVEEEGLRWYLEDYAKKNPSMTGRAAAAAAFLTNYGSNLISAINWKAVLSVTELQQPLSIIVDETDQHSSDTSTKPHNAHVFWELLERRDLWPTSLHSPSVAVTRTVSAMQLPPSDTPLVTSRRKLNVLIVVARPAGGKDVPHRLVSQIVLETAFHGMHVAVVCPGTFEAFKTSMQNEYYDIVHFDVHGFEDLLGWCV